MFIVLRNVLSIEQCPITGQWFWWRRLDPVLTMAELSVYIKHRRIYDNFRDIVGDNSLMALSVTVWLQPIKSVLFDGLLPRPLGRATFLHQTTSAVAFEAELRRKPPKRSAVDFGPVRSTASEVDQYCRWWMITVLNIESVVGARHITGDGIDKKSRY